MIHSILARAGAFRGRRDPVAPGGPSTRCTGPEFLGRESISHGHPSIGQPSAARCYRDLVVETRDRTYAAHDHVEILADDGSQADRPRPSPSGSRRAQSADLTR